MSPQSEKHNRLSSFDIMDVGNFAGECSVSIYCSLAMKFNFLFIFLGSLTLRDGFPGIRH